MKIFALLLFAFASAGFAVTPQDCRDRPVVETLELRDRGRDLFLNETFGGNGRTCGTCHREDHNFVIDAAYIAKLPKTDPLFVFERVPALRGLEDTRMLRSRGLILENLDGFDKPPVFRAVQTINGLRKTLSIGVLDSVTGEPVHETGWSGDGAPGDGSLRCFAVGAVIQHMPKTLQRRAGIDFRLPTDEELDALLVWQLSQGRQTTPRLSKMKFRNPDVQEGARKFSVAVMKTRAGGTDARRCGGCHVDGGAGDQEPVQIDRQRVTNVSFSPNAPVCDSGVPAAQTIDGGLGLGQRFLESIQCGRRTLFRPLFADIDQAGLRGSFNIQSVWEAVEAAPFFHDNSAKTVEQVLDFYASDAFDASQGNEGRAFVFTPDDRRQLAALLRVMSVLENIRGALEQIQQGRPGLARIDIAEAQAALIASKIVPQDAARNALSQAKALLSRDYAAASAQLLQARSALIEEGV
jgi:cytochrome c peroxidase